ncbi:MAG: FAD-binding protein [Solirubrobacteraceae bacterium]
MITLHRTTDVAPTLAAGLEHTGGLIARGAGRSYGDAAQNAGGWVLEMTALNRIIDLDRVAGTIRVEAGATVAQLLRRAARDGFTLPVLPGTRHVTVGGAIAADVHGKNHVRDGSLARHLVSFALCTPAGEMILVDPEGEPALFAATVGGMGLTGVVTEATLRLERLASPWMQVDTDRTRDLDQTMSLMADDAGHRYQVAWVDLLAPGRRLGRSVVSRADHAACGEHPAPELERHARLNLPSSLPSGLLTLRRMRAFNALRWRLARERDRGRRVGIGAHFFPLDALGDWNRLYGPSGLVQYQFAVPPGGGHVIGEVVRRLRARRFPAALATLKRLGSPSAGLLSFPIEGWTLAVDLPADLLGLRSALAEFDELVAEAGGRVYLAKDGCLRRDLLRAMYPKLGQLEALRAQVDPKGLLRSDLARRLGLS